MNRRTAALGQMAGALALLVAGCGGGSGGSGSIPFEQLEPAVLAAVCHYELLCGVFPDLATCMASEYAEPHLFDTLAGDISSGKVAYDGAQARACVDTLNAISSCDRTAVAMLTLDPDCGNGAVFKGTVASGGACFFTQECADNGTCQATDSSCSIDQCCPGTCVARSAPVAVGGDCSAAGATCVSGSVCVFDSTTTTVTETCQIPSQAGGPCTSILSCVNPLFCDAQTKTCQSPVAEGGACNPSNGSPGCNDPHDRCDPTTMLCTPRLGLGSACDPTNDACASYAVCDPTTSACVERPTVGASCTPGAPPACLGGSCDATSMTCTLPATAGACS
jgi:hypothetical protein